MKLKRPRFNAEMAKKLALKYVDTIMKYSSYKNEEDVLKDAIDIFTHNYHEDGFQLAKRFEDKYGYNVNSLMVEDLDCVSHDSSDILAEFVKEWVKENNIKLELSVGQTVIIDAWKKNNEEGEIVKLFHEKAEYGIWHPSLEFPKGQGYAHYGFEEIKKVVR